MVWVDDFLVHASALELCMQAINLLLDYLERLRLLAHKSKVKALAQSQCFCGFIYNIRGCPTVHIPLEKRDSVVALVFFLEMTRARGQLSRLTLAVIVGKL